MLIKIDDHDNAIIGTSTIWQDHSQVEVLVYSAKKIIKNLTRCDMTFEEALEYIDYNIVGAWVGKNTPVIVWDLVKFDERDYE